MSRLLTSGVLAEMEDITHQRENMTKCHVAVIVIIECDIGNQMAL